MIVKNIKDKAGSIGEWVMKFLNETSPAQLAFIAPTAVAINSVFCFYATLHVSLLCIKLLGPGILPAVVSGIVLAPITVMSTYIAFTIANYAIKKLIKK